MSKLYTTALTFTVLAFAPLSSWAAIMGTGGGFDILDNQTASSTIAIAEDRMVESLFITMDVEHSWVGDLTMTLTNPGGITADIMVRPGGGNFADPGDGSDLGSWFYPPNTTTPAFANNPLRYSFGDLGTPDFWGAAAAIGPNETIPEDTYQASDVTGAAVSLNTIFANAATQGDWTLTVADGASPDEGRIVLWELTIEPVAAPGTGPGPGPGVPVPGTLLLLLAGLAGLRIGNRVRG